MRSAGIVRRRNESRAAKNKAENVQDFKAKEETHATRNANGTGPFKLGRWETDVRTVLLAHPGYWGKRGNVTEAHYLVVASAATKCERGG